MEFLALIRELNKITKVYSAFEVVNEKKKSEVIISLLDLRSYDELRKLFQQTPITNFKFSKLDRIVVSEPRVDYIVHYIK